MDCGKSHSVVVSKVVTQSYVGDRRYSRLMKALGGQCEACGSTKHLQIHHKIPLSVKDLQSISRYNSWNDLSNLELLCKRCHNLKHRKYKLTVHKGLTSKEVKEIKKLYADGITQSEIAKKFQVATSTVRYHLRKKS